MSISLKKLTLAVIGAGAITCEKTAEIVEQLAEKGAGTVEQGKAMNSELRHNVKESVGRQKDIVKEAAGKAKADVEAKRAAKRSADAGILDTTPEEVVDDAAKAAKDIIDVVSKLSAEQLDAVKKALDALNSGSQEAEEVPEEENEDAPEDSAEEADAAGEPEEEEAEDAPEEAEEVPEAEAAPEEKPAAEE